MSQRGEKPRAKLWSTGLILSLFIVLMPLGLGGSGGASILPPDILGFTFIIQAPALNTYNAYRSGVSAMTPIFQESNFSRLMNNDILPSQYCALPGCTISLSPANYNLTQGIIINRPGIGIYGFPASVLVAQNITTYNGACGTFRPLICITSSNIVLSGFKIDDHNRDNTANVAGDAIAVASTSSNGLIQSMTIQNASSNAINIQGSNYVVTTSTLTGFHTGTGGNYGILMGSTTSSVRIFLNSISSFNGSDVAGINSANGASFITITANNIFFNSFGISSVWGKFVTIEANHIHDNYAGGILLTTGALGSQAGGPVTINDNVITNNGREPGLDVQCNSQHCSGIILRAAKLSWDGIAIVSNTIKDTQTTPTQYYGISVFGTISCTVTNCYSNVTITGNTFGRTLSGTTINLAVPPLKSWIIAENPGYNPQPVRGPLTAGATPFTYTNLDGYKEQIELITIGDMTAFTCRGIANIIQVDAISPILNTLDTCVFTYVAVAPTYDVLPT